MKGAGRALLHFQSMHAGGVRQPFSGHAHIASESIAYSEWAKKRRLDLRIATMKEIDL